jgi:hypothetical protein
MNWLDKGSEWLWMAFLAIVGGIIKWAHGQSRELQTLKLHVADNYVKKTDIERIREDIREQIRSEVEPLGEQLGEIRQILLSRKR